MKSIKVKITFIILATGISSFLISYGVISVYLSTVSDSTIEHMSEENLLFATLVVIIIFGVLMGLIFIISTVTLINRIIVKRIKLLETQTQEVIKGNFDDHIEMNQKDEIGKLARTYKTMLLELRKNEYLSKSFIRDYSHEIKTPLSSINGYATLIKESSNEDDIKEYAELIRFESKRLATMSVDLLKISELESKEIIVKDDLVNITELIREIILMTETIWSSKSLSLDLNFDEVTLKTNYTLIYTVLLNLITNAIKYAPSRSVIRVNLHQLDRVQFDISNAGSLSEDELSKIYTLFYTTDTNNAKRSSGVGLALVNRIATKLNYDLNCISEKDIVTFKITI